MSLFFLLVPGFGLGVYCYFAWLRRVSARLVQEGNTTEATVVRLLEIGDGGRWVPILSYMVNGVEYAKKYRWPIKHLSGLDYGPKHDSYLGKKITVFYDAKKPSLFVAAGNRKILNCFIK